MKRTLSAILSLLLVFTALAFVGCEKNETVKLGLGIHTVTKATSASEDANGKGQVTMTVAAVTLDKAGKIVSCQLDTADFTGAYTAEGKAVANESFKTKYELGTAYNMVAAGAVKEWFEQADVFEGVVVGKTIDEVKALVAEGNKGTDDVMTAGCTIMVNDFVKAIEKAVANAVDSTATTADTLKIGSFTHQTTKDAAEDVTGSNKLETTFFAATIAADGKVTAAASDCVQVEFGFDATGATTFDKETVASKREAGANYGMVASGVATKEWFEQADAFNATCVGKTISEISGLMEADNYYGNADVKAAGCTIMVNGFVKAAAKLG